MYSKIIIKPVLTEKMAILEERENKFAFLVSTDANKMEIKKAVESKFDVKVVKVATMNQSGKRKQMTVRSGGRTIRTTCLLYTSPSPRDGLLSRMPSSA